MADPIRKPIAISGRRKILTKNIILESHKHTKSNNAAAKWLNVSYNTYKKWAKYYDVFDQHLNPKGFGIKKGWAYYRIPLDKILSGERQPPVNYTHTTIKRRFIKEGYIDEECAVCGYNERNLKSEEVCLTIDFENGNHKDFSAENVRLLCPNCYLSYNGFFMASKTFCK
jgi:hypothetical protein